MKKNNKKKKIFIATYATKRYAYAIPNWARRMSACLAHSSDCEGIILLVSDKSDMVEKIAGPQIAGALPEGWSFQVQNLDLADDATLKNYKKDAQLLIAQMQSSALAEARKTDCEYFWSVESDVLVPYNALECAIQSLEFDSGYYDVAMVTYPSQGGGSFLGGRGSYQHQIAEDFLPEEREVPEEILKEIKERDEIIGSKGFEPTEEWFDRGREIHEEVKKCPPKQDIWKTIGEHGWRKRGWMEYAYPAIVKGAILPTDWVGMCCTLLSRKALLTAHFDGYEGSGTQDLYLGWNCWKPLKMNFAVITHTVCDHVIRARGQETDNDGSAQDFGKVILVHAHHENEGDYEGHLRQTHKPHYMFLAGEKWNEANDGRAYPPPQDSEKDKNEKKDKDDKKPPEEKKTD